MTQYRKKPVVVEASQWWTNGDHPEDHSVFIGAEPNRFLTEGQVVRYFRLPTIPGSHICTVCGRTMHEHGWIDTLEAGHRVCPGDWIITGVAGERYPCKATIFAETYEVVDAPDRERA